MTTPKLTFLGRWHVRRDPVCAMAVVSIPGPWRVETPRHVEVFRTPTHRQAVELADRFAGIEAMLTRLAATRVPVVDTPLPRPSLAVVTETSGS